MAVDDLDDQLDYEFVQSDTSDENVDAEISDVETGEQDPNQSATDKKARSKARQKERKRIKNEADRVHKQQLAFLEPALIADHIAKLVAKSKPELSAVELQDRTVPESQIVFTGNKVRDRSSVQKIGSFLEQFGLKKKPQGKKDLVLVLCMSAIRVCEVVRAIRGSKTSVALKLIKQNKPEYDQRCLKSAAHIAVSTPGRIFKLQELKILDTKRIKNIVVDTSILDSKQRTIWDIEGTIELVSELAHQNKTKIYLF